MRGRIQLSALVVAAALASAPVAPRAAEPTETETVRTAMGFDQLVEELKGAVRANGMLNVFHACASCAAKGRGVDIPGNAVIGVFRNDYAVRMLKASIAAGFEAPIRFYVTENEDGTASLTYRMPSVVFAPYDSAELDAMAEELDRVWLDIIEDATEAG